MRTQVATENTLRRWTLPANYMGAKWPDYYSAGVGQSRDSSAFERANFDAMLALLGGEKSGGEDPKDEGSALSLVRVVRASHWAVGWVEWIAIVLTKHKTINSILIWNTANRIKLPSSK